MILYFSWTLSKATKDGVDTDIAKYNGEWGISQSKENSLSGDSGLLLKEKAKYALQLWTFVGLFIFISNWCFQLIRIPQ